MTWKTTLLAGIAVPTLTIALTACSSDDDSGIDIDGAPDGFSVTEPGSELSVDDTAHVVTKHGDGSTRFFDLGPVTFRDLPADAAELNGGNDDVDHFVCVGWDVTYRGDAGNGTNPDDERPVADPQVTAVGEQGQPANSVMMDLSDTCGSRDDELPDISDDLEVDHTYKATKLSYVGKDGKGVDPTGIKFSFSGDIPGLEDPEDITWN